MKQIVQSLRWEHSKSTSKGKPEIRNEWLNCNNGSIKQIIRKTRNDNLWEWSVSARARNLPISETVVGNGGSE
jgi:hypothetical protein